MQELIYRIKRPFHFIKTGLLRGFRAQLKHNFPANKIKVLLITGTDGKTTTSSLLYHLLNQAKKKVGLISTVGAYIGNKKVDTGLHVTAPGPEKLQSFIKKMVDKKFEYLVLEFTSHGAYQFRDWGIKPYIAGLTNITHEHLDYHLTYKNYLEAKLLLLKKAKIVFLNQNDQSFYELKEKLNAKKQKVKSYSLGEELDEKIKKAISKTFPEKFNQANAHLATAIALELGLEPKQIAAGIKSFMGVPGRMDFVKNKKNLQIVIDFAHTPNGLESALKALRKQLAVNSKKGRLIAVLGCAGLRDRTKRPEMGKIASELADFAVFTAEDPRTENVWSIIRQMKEQLTENHNKIVSIADRQAAIKFALTKIAKPGDTIAILGKGPEKSMCFGHKEYPWSDREAVLQVLREMK